MRTSLIALPLLLFAGPALAQTTPPAPPAVQPQEMQRVLNDPAMVDRMTNVMQALGKAFLDMPIGGIEAAVEGRQATPAERRRTVRDIEPGIGRDVQAQMAQAKPMVRQSMKALSDSLPAMMNGLKQVQESLERAAANMPDPTYPKR
jgi:2',3'-cyclic-nucleotide 2'-phosphodiesterase (5'-nucleotidase family)